MVVASRRLSMVNFGGKANFVIGALPLKKYKKGVVVGDFFVFLFLVTLALPRVFGFFNRFLQRYP